MSSRLWLTAVTPSTRSISVRLSHASRYRRAREQRIRRRRSAPPRMYWRKKSGTHSRWSLAAPQSTGTCRCRRRQVVMGQMRPKSRSERYTGLPSFARRGDDGAGEAEMEDRVDVVALGGEPRAGRKPAPDGEAGHGHPVDLLAGRRAVVGGDHGHRVAAREERTGEELEAPGGAAGSPRMVVLRGENDLHVAWQTAKNPAFSSG